MTTAGSPAVLCVVLSLGAGCGTNHPAGREPGPYAPASAATSGPDIGDCTTRVDALIDSRTIPRSDREYAIGMCIDNR